MEDELDLARITAWVFVIGLLIGLCILGWIYLLGPMFNQASYNNFNTSPQHMNAVAQKFSDDCLQLSQTTDLTTKKAIENDINYQASTVDLNKVAMPDSVRTCVNNAIADINHQK